MLRLNGEILIGNETFITDLNYVEVNSTWETFTDTANVVLPMRKKKANEIIAKSSENTLFKVGDSIDIKLGYFPTLDTRFKGFITKVSPDLPIRLECQDIMYLLKQCDVKMSFAKVSISELVTEALKQAEEQQSTEDRKEAVRNIKINYIDPNINLGSFRTVGGAVNFVGILKELKKVYGLQSFSFNGELFVGSPYNLTRKDKKVHNIVWERNIIDSGLEWQNEEDVKIKIKAVSMLPDNTKLEVSAGNADGETRTFFTYGVTSEKELKELANNEISRFKYSGFRGGFLTFGEPYIKHGDTILLKNKKIPERDGYYKVDEVNTFFGFDGFRQEVKLGALTDAEPLTIETEKINELSN